MTYKNMLLNIQNIIAYLFAIAVLGFTIVMITMVLPYLSFERAINFLGTKSDAVLDKNYFMWAFYIHITSSIFSLGGGVFQFFPAILRGRFSSIHHWIGKIYVLTILVLAAPSGLILALYANGGLAAKVGFSMQCVVWWLTTWAAWREIERKNWLAHSDMMIRSFAVTLAAMSLRTESYAMYYFFQTKPIETYLTVVWTSWVGNLLMAEILIYNGLGKQLITHLRRK